MKLFCPPRLCCLLFAAATFLSGLASAATNDIPVPGLPQNTRLMMWGDSITEGNAYPTYIEEYLLVCAGRKDIKVFTCGHSGAGIGELTSRTIDLKMFNPSAVMFDYGMNDTQYSPYTAEKGASFGQTMQQGLTALANNGVTLRIVAGPGNVAPRYSTDPNTTAAQNDCLSHFSSIGRTTATNAGAYFSDVYDRMSDSCAAADAVYGQSYGYDVHCGPNGSILIAYEDLKTLACDGNIGTINVDMSGGATASTGHTVVSAANGVVVLDSSVYPFCYNYDPANTTGFESLDSMLPYVPFSQDLNRLILKVANLTGSGASVTWGSQTRTFTAAQLTAGVNLAEQFSQTPFDAAFAQIHAAIVRKQSFETYESKGTSNYFGNDAGGNVDNNMIAVQAQFDAGVKALYVPVRHALVIVPTGAAGPAKPVITGTMSAYPTTGQAFSYQIATTPSASQFAATGLPGGLTLNTNTGVISGTASATGTTTATLTATNAAGSSSTQLTITAQAPIPNLPSINSPTTASATVGVPFSYQITATNNPTNYFVSVQGDHGTEPPDTSLPPGLTYDTTTGLISGTPTAAGTYNNSVNLAAMNAGGVSAQLISLVISGNGNGSTPPAPTGLTAAAGNGQVSLNWTASTGATSYQIFRGTASGSEGTNAIASSTTNSYNDATAANGTLYYYTVKAVNSYGVSGSSNEASATPVAAGPPAAPTGLTAAAGNTQVGLNWQASTGATSYNVYRGTLAGSVSTTPVATGVTATNYKDINLPNGPTEYYKVAAVNSYGTSGYSNEASATPAATNVNGLTVISVQFGGNTIAGGGLTAGVIPESIWNGDVTSASYFTVETTGISNLKDSTGVTNSGLNETKTDYGTYGPNAATTGFANAGDNELFSHGPLVYGDDKALTLRLSGLNPSATYDLILYAYSTQGTYGAAQVTATTPGGSTYYFTTPFSSQSTYVQATSTTAGTFPVANYVKWSNLTPSGNTLAATLNAPSGMTANGFQLVMHSPATAAPATPVGLTATPGTGTGQITLNWTATTGASSYQIQRSTSPTGPYAGVVTVAAPATTYTDISSALVAGQNYYYEIDAIGDGGTSAFSAYVTAQPYVPATFGGWAYRYFGANAPASQTAETANPANDGLPNLVKYALGLDPRVTALFHPGLDHVGATWQFTYQLAANRPDITCVVQVSPNLASGSWTTAGVTSVQTNTGDPQTWQSTYTPSSGSACFFRLQVTRQ